jgi:outer membrane protein OmpA-like peptidoglycan-associated protein
MALPKNTSVERKHDKNLGRSAPRDIRDPAAQPDDAIDTLRDLLLELLNGDPRHRPGGEAHSEAKGLQVQAPESEELGASNALPLANESIPPVASLELQSETTGEESTSEKSNPAIASDDDAVVNSGEVDQSHSTLGPDSETEAEPAVEPVVETVAEPVAEPAAQIQREPETEVSSQQAILEGLSALLLGSEADLADDRPPGPTQLSEVELSSEVKLVPEATAKPYPTTETTEDEEDVTATPELKFGLEKAVESESTAIVARSSPSSSMQSAENGDDPLQDLQTLLFGTKLSEIERVQQLLGTYDLASLNELLLRVEEHLKNLESQIYEPQKLINLLLPLITEILNRKVAESKEDVAQALVPIIDEVIKNRSLQNRVAMSEAIATVLPGAIARQIRDSPEEVAKAIGPEMAAAIREQIRLDRDSIAKVLAPEMGRTIKEQIRVERDAMVDALYPVIGNTISKYMAEAIRTINEKVSNALSMEGIQRKIRATAQGVSEAELILQESIPFIVPAIFLIHKGSGLVIAEVQQSGSQRLESEMVAGMLTAIRSFVNDCIVQTGDTTELNQIEYGDSQIAIEVAGYCYLAVVIQGVPSKKFIEKIRRTLATIILEYGEEVEGFDGDPETVPHPVEQLLADLMTSEASKKPIEPYALMALCGAIAALVAIPWGIHEYRDRLDRQVERQAFAALSGTPELAVYRLEVEADRDRVILDGKLPNEPLREQAGAIAAEVVGDRAIDNQIIAVDVPPDPVLVRAEVERVTAVLNQIEGVEITSSYDDRQVSVKGTVRAIADVDKITEAMRQIPGVHSVVSAIEFDPLEISTRIYFEPGSFALKSSYQETLARIKGILDEYPRQHLRLVGHSDRTGNPQKNQQLALKRAQVVREALIRQGVAGQRLHAIGKSEGPVDVESNQPLLLSRVVVFELMASGSEK